MNEIIEELRKLLKEKLSGDYKKFYYGEVLIPDFSVFPFLEIIPMGTRIINKGTGGMIDNEYRIQIQIKETLKKYLKENTQTETIEHVKKLVEKMEGRDENGNIKENTVIGVLKNNLQINGKANILGEWEIIYDEINLGESYIIVGSVSFICKNISI